MSVYRAIFNVNGISLYTGWSEFPQEILRDVETIEETLGIKCNLVAEKENLGSGIFDYHPRDSFEKIAAQC